MTFKYQIIISSKHCAQHFAAFIAEGAMVLNGTQTKPTSEITVESLDPIQTKPRKQR